MEFDFGCGVGVEVGEGRVKEDVVRTRNRELFVDGQRLRVAHTVLERLAEPLTCQRHGAVVVCRIAQGAADGSKIAAHYTVPAAGGAGKIESPAWDGITGKRINPTEREMLYMKGGKTVYTTHSKLSADGKSLTVDSKGLNVVGKEVEAQTVYDKQ